MDIHYVYQYRIYAYYMLSPIFPLLLSKFRIFHVVVKIELSILTTLKDSIFEIFFSFGGRAKMCQIYFLGLDKKPFNQL